MTDAPRPWIAILRRWAVLLPLIAAWDWWECNVPVMIEQRIAVKDLPAGTTLKLAHLSDVHDHEPFGGYEPLLDRFRAFKPDAVVITGDLVDRGTRDFSRAFLFAERLTTVARGVFYVPGNHEFWTGRLDELKAGLRQRGVTVLPNRRARFGPIEVVGVDDAYTGRDQLAVATAGLVPAACAVVITHAPELADKLGDAPVDLILAGHTHGGQIRIPGLGALLAPGQGFFPRWDKGLYELPGGRTLYVDSGLGTSGAPLRFFNRAQASLLTLVPR